MSTRGTKRFIRGFFILWVALMAIFTFADLNVSKALYNEEHSRFGWFFEVYGEHPAFLVLFGAGSILFSTVRDARLVKKILIRLITGLFILLSGFSIDFLGKNAFPQYGWRLFSVYQLVPSARHSGERGHG